MTKIPLVIEQTYLLNMMYILHAWIRKWQHMSLMGHDDLTLSEYLIYLSDFGVHVDRVFTLFLSVLT